MFSNLSINRPDSVLESLVPLSDQFLIALWRKLGLLQCPTCMVHDLVERIEIHRAVAAGSAAAPFHSTPLYCLMVIVAVAGP